MQDRRLQIDEPFINHAWDQMRKQLDVEMPTEQDKRRRFGWFWWSAVVGLLLVTASAGYAVWGRKPVQTTNRAVKPVAVDAMQKGRELNVPKTRDEAVLTNTDQGLFDKAILPSTDANSISGKSLQKEYLNVNRLGSSVGIMTGQKAQADIAISNLPAQNEPIINGLAPDLKASKSGNEEMENSVVVANAVAVQLRQLNNFDFEKTNPSIDIEPLKFKQRRLSIEANYSHAINLPSMGGGASIVSSKSFKNNKFRFQYGLGYSFIQQPLEVELAGYQLDGNGQVAEEVVFYGTSNDGKSADEALGSNAVVRTSRKQGLNLHYLTLPVRLSYAVTNRFSVRMGLDAGVLLKAKSDFVEGGVLGRFPSRTFGFFSSEQKPGTSSSSDGNYDYDVSTLDLATTFGFEYRISNRLNVAAQYRHGLKDVLPKNITKDFNRFLQVSLIYNLPKRR